MTPSAKKTAAIVATIINRTRILPDGQRDRLKQNTRYNLKQNTTFACMTTKQAFEKLLNDTALIDRSGIPPGNVRQWKKRLRDGVKVSIAVMEDALIRAGAKKVPEKWTFKK